MLHIQESLYLDERELDFGMIRAQGAGGQNVNKVASAVHLRFDVPASALPDEVKEAILALADRRISKDGVLIIKAQAYRSQDKNRADAVERLLALLRQALVKHPTRRATRPTMASKRRRVQRKVQRGDVKRLRGRVGED
ncbi:alternative ribosome rescue aminoacyl-tRNA hydrolase ArfB [Bordetella holmesii]|uniref:RF-1 domain protein n=2 Tax=Bordetella holmesii TaxID=35814 RepID=A0A158M6K9_9BORD|nr:alternative ribosome rescue aminoacyl-tRNA hydrolase ArfB [Bordetella holmesii]AHV92183.1 RF-1 domain protein [Bordetella holmesii ATCC 51541]AIT28378.1 RF-1 domain protein [Bordetella holmesii 44057]EWM41167.1 RF-1 domain protein [Bordetella holmesii 35009]EWM44230.1 RF-1 domain protein [Bordetella holmesii 41130]EWM45057.1 RF-1 domain protein [Bordetella holmesii 70147]